MGQLMREHGEHFEARKTLFLNFRLLYFCQVSKKKNILKSKEKRKKSKEKQRKAKKSKEKQRKAKKKKRRNKEKPENQGSEVQFSPQSHKEPNHLSMKQHQYQKLVRNKGDLFFIFSSVNR